jgi:hypothetical protein
MQLNFINNIFKDFYELTTISLPQHLPFPALKACQQQTTYFFHCPQSEYDPAAKHLLI